MIHIKDKAAAGLFDAIASNTQAKAPLAMPAAQAATGGEIGPIEREPEGARAARLILIANDLARELHREVRLAQPLGLDSHLERDWGFDSLARMELLLRIERSFAVSIPERWLGEAETLRQLLPVIAEAKPIPLSAPREAAAPAVASAVRLPLAAATLTEVLDFHAEINGDRPHVVLPEEGGGETVLSYRELAGRARRAAVFFRRRGLEPGSRVALMLPTGLDFFVIFFAILYARAVPTPLYPPLRATEIEDHLKRQSKILDNAEAKKVPVRFRFSNGKPAAWTDVAPIQVNKAKTRIHFFFIFLPSKVASYTWKTRL